jgi:Domain of unknown function (DUF4372)
MRHQRSVFPSLLKHVPWAAVDRLVEAHGADARVRRLTTKDQFVALLYGQMASSPGRQVCARP